MVKMAEEALRLRPHDTQALNRWRGGTLASLCLCDSIALSGFALPLLGETLHWVLPFYGAAILLMLLWTPRLEVSGPGPAQ